MAAPSPLARPYAEAVFALAKDSGQLKEWSDLLQAVSMIATDEDMQSIIGNTSVNKEQVAQLIIDVADSGSKNAMEEQGRNLIKLLAENRRLNVTTEITEHYETLKAEAEKSIEAEIVSAIEINAKQQSIIIEKLKKRLGREISLKCTIDESLMGGAIIKAGDTVIDGSVSGQLNKLSVELAG